MTADHLTDEQRRNLATLALYVHALPADYNRLEMFKFMASETFASGGVARKFTKEENECGTAACLCGHGPMAGIQPLEREDWPTYSARVFGAPASDIRGPFGWMFDQYLTNDRAEGVKRIAWLLFGGEIMSRYAFQRQRERPEGWEGFEVNTEALTLLALIAEGKA
jgi:hypothetical protein